MATETETPQPKSDFKSAYDIFETDKSLEQTGITLDYGPFWFKVARAGGENTRYRDLLRERMKPHQKALQIGAMDDTLANEIAASVFAETIVLGWGSKEHGEGKFSDREHKPLPFSVENVKRVFQDLPELALDVMNQAQNMTLFRRNIAELDGKN